MTDRPASTTTRASAKAVFLSSPTNCVSCECVLEANMSCGTKDLSPEDADVRALSGASRSARIASATRAAAVPSPGSSPAVAPVPSRDLASREVEEEDP